MLHQDGVQPIAQATLGSTLVRRRSMNRVADSCSCQGTQDCLGFSPLPTCRKETWAKTLSPGGDQIGQGVIAIMEWPAQAQFKNIPVA